MQVGEFNVFPNSERCDMTVISRLSRTNHHAQQQRRGQDKLSEVYAETGRALEQSGAPWNM